MNQISKKESFFQYLFVQSIPCSHLKSLKFTDNSFSVPSNKILSRKNNNYKKLHVPQPLASFFLPLKKIIGLLTPHKGGLCKGSLRESPHASRRGVPSEQNFGAKDLDRICGEASHIQGGFGAKGPFDFIFSDKTKKGKPKAIESRGLGTKKSLPVNPFDSPKGESAYFKKRRGARDDFAANKKMIEDNLVPEVFGPNLQSQGRATTSSPPSFRRKEKSSLCSANYRESHECFSKIAPEFYTPNRISINKTKNLETSIQTLNSIFLFNKKIKKISGTSKLFATQIQNQKEGNKAHHITKCHEKKALSFGSYKPKKEKKRSIFLDYLTIYRPYEFSVSSLKTTKKLGSGAPQTSQSVYNTFFTYKKSFLCYWLLPFLGFVSLTNFGLWNSTPIKFPIFNLIMSEKFKNTKFINNSFLFFPKELGVRTSSTATLVAQGLNRSKTNFLGESPFWGAPKPLFLKAQKINKIDENRIYKESRAFRPPLRSQSKCFFFSNQLILHHLYRKSNHVLEPYPSFLKFSKNQNYFLSLYSNHIKKSNLNFQNKKINRLNLASPLLAVKSSAPPPTPYSFDPPFRGARAKPCAVCSPFSRTVCLAPPHLAPLTPPLGGVKGASDLVDPPKGGVSPFVFSKRENHERESQRQSKFRTNQMLVLQSKKNLNGERGIEKKLYTSTDFPKALFLRIFYLNYGPFFARVTARPLLDQKGISPPLEQGIFPKTLASLEENLNEESFLNLKNLSLKFFNKNLKDKTIFKWYWYDFFLKNNVPQSSNINKINYFPNKMLVLRGFEAPKSSFDKGLLPLLPTYKNELDMGFVFLAKQIPFALSPFFALQQRGFARIGEKQGFYLQSKAFGLLPLKGGQKADPVRSIPFLLRKGKKNTNDWLISDQKFIAESYKTKLFPVSYFQSISYSSKLQDPRLPISNISSLLKPSFLTFPKGCKKLDPLPFGENEHNNRFRLSSTNEKNKGRHYNFSMAAKGEVKKQQFFAVQMQTEFSKTQINNKVLNYFIGVSSSKSLSHPQQSKPPFMVCRANKQGGVRGLRLKPGPPGFFNTPRDWGAAKVASQQRSAGEAGTRIWGRVWGEAPWATLPNPFVLQTKEVAKLHNLQMRFGGKRAGSQTTCFAENKYELLTPPKEGVRDSNAISFYNGRKEDLKNHQEEKKKLNTPHKSLKKATLLMDHLLLNDPQLPNFVENLLKSNLLLNTDLFNYFPSILSSAVCKSRQEPYLVQQSKLESALVAKQSLASQLLLNRSGCFTTNEKNFLSNLNNLKGITQTKKGFKNEVLALPCPPSPRAGSDGKKTVTRPPFRKREIGGLPSPLAKQPLGFAPVLCFATKGDGLLRNGRGVKPTPFGLQSKEKSGPFFLKRRVKKTTQQEGTETVLSLNNTSLLYYCIFKGLTNNLNKIIESFKFPVLKINSSVLAGNLRKNKNNFLFCSPSYYKKEEAQTLLTLLPPPFRGGKPSFWTNGRWPYGIHENSYLNSLLPLTFAPPFWLQSPSHFIRRDFGFLQTEIGKWKQSKIKLSFPHPPLGGLKERPKLLPSHERFCQNPNFFAVPPRKGLRSKVSSIGQTPYPPLMDSKMPPFDRKTKGRFCSFLPLCREEKLEGRSPLLLHPPLFTKRGVSNEVKGKGKPESSNITLSSLINVSNPFSRSNLKFLNAPYPSERWVRGILQSSKKKTLITEDSFQESLLCSQLASRPEKRSKNRKYTNDNSFLFFRKYIKLFQKNIKLGLRPYKNKIGKTYLALGTLPFLEKLHYLDSKARGLLPPIPKGIGDKDVRPPYPYLLQSKAPAFLFAPQTGCKARDLEIVLNPPLGGVKGRVQNFYIKKDNPYERGTHLFSKGVQQSQKIFLENKNFLKKSKFEKTVLSYLRKSKLGLQVDFVKQKEKQKFIKKSKLFLIPIKLKNRTLNKLSPLVLAMPPLYSIPYVLPPFFALQTKGVRKGGDAKQELRGLPLYQGVLLHDLKKKLKSFPSSFCEIQSNLKYFHSKLTPTNNKKSFLMILKNKLFINKKRNNEYWQTHLCSSPCVARRTPCFAPLPLRSNPSPFVAKQRTGAKHRGWEEWENQKRGVESQDRDLASKPPNGEVKKVGVATESGGFAIEGFAPQSLHRLTPLVSSAIPLTFAEQRPLTFTPSLRRGVRAPSEGRAFVLQPRAPRLASSVFVAKQRGFEGVIGTFPLKHSSSKSKPRASQNEDVKVLTSNEIQNRIHENRRKKQHLKLKRRLKKMQCATRRRKKRKIFYPRPKWLTFLMYNKFLNLRFRNSQTMFPKTPCYQTVCPFPLTPLGRRLGQHKPWRSAHPGFASNHNGLQKGVASFKTPRWFPYEIFYEVPQDKLHSIKIVRPSMLVVPKFPTPFLLSYPHKSFEAKDLALQATAWLCNQSQDLCQLLLCKCRGGIFERANFLKKRVLTSPLPLCFVPLLRKERGFTTQEKQTTCFTPVNKTKSWFATSGTEVEKINNWCVDPNRNSKDFYTISDTVSHDLRRILMKSNWLRSYLNPYLNKIKYIYKEMENESKKMTLFTTFRFCILSLYGSFFNLKQIAREDAIEIAPTISKDYYQNLNPLSSFLFTKAKPCSPEGFQNQFKQYNSVLKFEYNRIIYQRIQRLILNIRENLNLNGQTKNRSKKLGKNIRPFIKREYIKHNTPRGLPNQNENFWGGAPQSFKKNILNLRRSFVLLNKSYREPSLYTIRGASPNFTPLVRNNLNWALNKTENLLNSGLANPLPSPGDKRQGSSSYSTKLWEKYKTREINKNNKTKKLIFQIFRKYKNILNDQNSLNEYSHPDLIQPKKLNQKKPQSFFYEDNINSLGLTLPYPPERGVREARPPLRGPLPSFYPPKGSKRRAGALLFSRLASYLPFRGGKEETFTPPKGGVNSANYQQREQLETQSSSSLFASFLMESSATTRGLRTTEIIPLSLSERNSPKKRFQLNKQHFLYASSALCEADPSCFPPTPPKGGVKARANKFQNADIQNLEFLAPAFTPNPMQSIPFGLQNKGVRGLGRGFVLQQEQRLFNQTLTSPTLITNSVFGGTALAAPPWLCKRGILVATPFKPLYGGIEEGALQKTSENAESIHRALFNLAPQTFRPSLPPGELAKQSKEVPGGLRLAPQTGFFSGSEARALPPLGKQKTSRSATQSYIDRGFLQSEKKLINIENKLKLLGLDSTNSLRPSFFCELRKPLKNLALLPSLALTPLKGVATSTVGEEEEQIEGSSCKAKGSVPKRGEEQKTQENKSRLLVAKQRVLRSKKPPFSRRNLFSFAPHSPYKNGKTFGELGNEEMAQKKFNHGSAQRQILRISPLKYKKIYFRFLNQELLKEKQFFLPYKFNRKITELEKLFPLDITKTNNPFYIQNLQHIFFTIKQNSLQNFDGIKISNNIQNQSKISNNTYWWTKLKVGFQNQKHFLPLNEIPNLWFAKQRPGGVFWGPTITHTAKSWGHKKWSSKQTSACFARGRGESLINLNNNPSATVISFLFHFCTVISFISLGGVRSVIKFYYILFSKTYKIINKLRFIKLFPTSVQKSNFNLDGKARGGGRPYLGLGYGGIPHNPQMKFGGIRKLKGGFGRGRVAPLYNKKAKFSKFESTKKTATFLKNRGNYSPFFTPDKIRRALQSQGLPSKATEAKGKTHPLKKQLISRNLINSFKAIKVFALKYLIAISTPCSAIVSPFALPLPQQSNPPFSLRSKASALLTPNLIWGLWGFATPPMFAKQRLGRGFALQQVRVFLWKTKQGKRVPQNQDNGPPFALQTKKNSNFLWFAKQTMGSSLPFCGSTLPSPLLRKGGGVGATKSSLLDPKLRFEGYAWGRGLAPLTHKGKVGFKTQGEFDKSLAPLRRTQRGKIAQLKKRDLRARHSFLIRRGENSNKLRRPLAKQVWLLRSHKFLSFPPLWDGTGSTKSTLGKQQIEKIKIFYEQNLSVGLTFVHKISFYSYLLFLKSVDILAVPALLIYKFFEKPGEYVVENLAYSFLLEWSADLISTIPDTLDTSFTVYFSKINRNFPFYFLGGFSIHTNILNHSVNREFPYFSSARFTPYPPERRVREWNKPRALLAPPKRGGLFTHPLPPFATQGERSKGIKQRGARDSQDESKLAVAKQTGPTMGLSNIVVSIMDSCFATKLIFETIFFAIRNSIFQRLTTSSLLLFVQQLAEPDLDYITRQKKGIIFWDIWGECLKTIAEENSVNIYELRTDKEEQLKLLSNIEQNKTLSLAAPALPLLAQPFALQTKGYASHRVRNKGRVREAFVAFGFPFMVFSVKRKPKGGFFLSRREWKTKQGHPPVPPFRGSSSFALPHPPKGLLHIANVAATGFAAQIKNKIKHKFQGWNRQTSSKPDRWSVNQFLNYQGKDTDLFIDLHPPQKFLATASSLKYSFSVQAPIGSIVCKIFGGIFYKQISKNILVVLNSNQKNNGFENSLLIQAIAGETELKIITDNAHRYAMVIQGVAVGIKQLKDVFEALCAAGPCLFLMEDIHAIGQRRPFLIDEASPNLTESIYNKNQSMQGFLLKEKRNASREILYKTNKHLLTNYKKPYKEFKSLARNHFSFTFLYRAASLTKIRTNEIKPEEIPLSIQVSKKERNGALALQKNQLTEKQGSSARLSSGGFGYIATSGKNKDDSQMIFKSIKSLKTKQFGLDSQTLTESSKIASEGQTNLYSSFSLLIESLKTKQSLINPPASSPFNLLLMKEATKLKHNQNVREMAWFGLPGEQYSLISKSNYSIRVKVALLADLVLSNLAVKLEMITDLLVIIDSVKGNRGFVIFATTHLPDILDPALRRPGRFDETLSLPLIPALYSRWTNYRYNVQYLTSSLFKNYSLPLNATFNKGTTLDLSKYTCCSNDSQFEALFPIYSSTINYISKKQCLLPLATKQPAQNKIWTSAFCKARGFVFEIAPCFASSSTIPPIPYDLPPFFALQTKGVRKEGEQSQGEEMEDVVRTQNLWRASWNSTVQILYNRTTSYAAHSIMSLMFYSSQTELNSFVKTGPYLHPPHVCEAKVSQGTPGMGCEALALRPLPTLSRREWEARGKGDVRFCLTPSFMVLPSPTVCVVPLLRKGEERAKVSREATNPWLCRPREKKLTLNWPTRLHESKLNNSFIENYSIYLSLFGAGELGCLSLGWGAEPPSPKKIPRSPLKKERSCLATQTERGANKKGKVSILPQNEFDFALGQGGQIIFSCFISSKLGESFGLGGFRASKLKKQYSLRPLSSNPTLTPPLGLRSKVRGKKKGAPNKTKGLCTHTSLVFGNAGGSFSTNPLKVAPPFQGLRSPCSFNLSIERKNNRAKRSPPSCYARPKTRLLKGAPHPQNENINNLNKFLLNFNQNAEWKNGASLLHSYIQKRLPYFEKTNLKANLNFLTFYSRKLLNFNNKYSLMEAPSPPISNILLPAKRYENYKRTFSNLYNLNFETNKTNDQVSSKIKLHQQQRLLKRLYNYPIKEFFRNEKISSFSQLNFDNIKYKYGRLRSPFLSPCLPTGRQGTQRQEDHEVYPLESQGGCFAEVLAFHQSQNQNQNQGTESSRQNEVPYNINLNNEVPYNINLNLANFTQSYLVFAEIENLAQKNFASLNQFSSLDRGTPHSYRNILYNRHRTYLTNQWWTGQQGEHNSETTFLSDIDWRYTQIRKLKANDDIQLDFPDSEQFYNPRNRRWILTKGDWNDWFNIETDLKDIYSHYIYESFSKIYKRLDQNRELLDLYSNNLFKLSFNLMTLKQMSLNLKQSISFPDLNQREILNLYKRFFYNTF